MENLYAVVVTYNRADFLENLLESFARLDTGPARIIVVDNASTDHTADVVAPGALAGGPPIRYERLTGERRRRRRIFPRRGTGAGSGAEWLWLMDDDVEVLPGAVDALDKFTPEYSCIDRPPLRRQRQAVLLAAPLRRGAGRLPAGVARRL